MELTLKDLKRLPWVKDLAQDFIRGSEEGNGKKEDSQQMLGDVAFQACFHKISHIKGPQRAPGRCVLHRFTMFCRCASGFLRCGSATRSHRRRVRRRQGSHMPRRLRSRKRPLTFTRTRWSTTATSDFQKRPAMLYILTCICYDI